LFSCKVNGGLLYAHLLELSSLRKPWEELIQARGCQLLFLPASSPDFSPIEETFSKVKTFLRRAGARTCEALQEAICQALLTVTAQDAHGWFRHCGYLPAKEEG
jgi:DDE superfamily endonuclease